MYIIDKEKEKETEKGKSRLQKAGLLRDVLFLQAVVHRSHSARFGALPEAPAPAGGSAPD